jgi:hypothetical protein
MKHMKLFILSVLLLGLSTLAWADGETRPATQAEKDYSLRMLTALSQALPKPLPGFEARDASRVAPFDRVTPGCEASPLRVDYSVSWVNPEQADKERAQEGAAIERAASKINTPAYQARQKDFAARQQKLATEYGKAIEKGDQAQAEKLQKEMEKLGQELNKLGQSQNDILQDETKSLTKLSQLSIRLVVNDFYEDQPARLAKELKPFAGNPAYIYHDSEGKFTDRMTVLVGPWKREIRNEQAVYQAAKASLPHTRAQTVIVTVTGDPSLTMKVLEGMNWKALQALLK